MDNHSIADPDTLLRQWLEAEDDVFSMNLLAAADYLATQPLLREPVLRTRVVARLFEVLQQTPYRLMRHRS